MPRLQVKIIVFPEEMKRTEKYKKGDTVFASGVSHASEKTFFSGPGVIDFVYHSGGYSVNWKDAKGEVDWIYFDHELSYQPPSNRIVSTLLHQY